MPQGELFNGGFATTLTGDDNLLSLLLQKQENGAAEVYPVPIHIGPTEVLYMDEAVVMTVLDINFGRAGYSATATVTLTDSHDMTLIGLPPVVTPIEVPLTLHKVGEVTWLHFGVPPLQHRPVDDSDGLNIHDLTTWNQLVEGEKADDWKVYNT